MSDILNIGANGLRAYSRAMATVGDNIANAQSPGYARRTLALREIPIASSNVLTRSDISPGGVEIAGVTRATDQWLTQEARLSSGDGERAHTKLDAMTQVESTFASDQNGTARALTSLFNVADQLTADPNNSALRGQFLQNIDEIAAGFRGTAARLARTSDNLAATTATATDQFNTDLQALEKTNASLRVARPGSTTEAALLDERDRTLDQLASQMAIDISFGQRGTVLVRDSGGGNMLVGDGAVHPITASHASDGRVGFSVGGQPMSLASGALAGLTDAANHIADQRIAIDRVASQIANQINSAHQNGRDANGDPGGALFTGTGSAASITAAPITAAQVASANAASDNGNMLAFGQLRGPQDAEALWADHVASQARSTAQARAQDAAATTRYESANAARSSVSEIDLDREAADLLRFQQAYTAAAQTIQIARETMQALFAII